MKIKNDSVRIQIGNKKYDFHNLILNEYIKRLIKKQLSKESATNSTLTESAILTYLLLKLDTPINNLTQDSSITNYDFDIAIIHGASKHQNISEKQVVMQYDYNILINDYVIDLNLVQQGKKSPETIKYLSDFYDRKITAIGFISHWYPYKEVPVCAVLDTSNYSIFLERNQDLTISRKDIITTDAEFSTNDKEKVKGPAHLSPLGLPQIIYQPSIVQTLKDDEGNDYIKKHEFYDYAKGVLTSVGLSQNPNYIEKEYKIGEDIQAVNNETEIEINGIINDEKEEGNAYPSDELFPIEPRTLPIQSSKGIKETSIKTNEKNDFFVNIDGKSTQDGTPTPSNPVEIKSIGDDINLINDADIINGSLSSGNIVSGYGYRLVTNNPIPVKSSTDCNINFRNIGEFKGVRVGIHSYDAEGNFISDSGWVSFTNLQATIKTGVNWKSVRFVFSFSKTSTSVTTGGTEYTGNITSDEFKTFKVKFQEGSKATGYSKYGEGTVTINQTSKNKLINSSFRENWTGWSLANNGTIAPEITEKLGQKCVHITGELQEGKYLGQWINTRVEKGKTYTLSGMVYLENFVPGTTNRFVAFYTDGKTTSGGWTSGFQILSGHTDFSPSINDYSKGFVKVTATLKVKDDTDLTKALGVFIYARDFTGDLYVYDVQLEESTEATDYEEYFNNTYTLPLKPLRSLPNGVKDTLEADGTHRCVGFKEFNGSSDEGWILNNTDKLRYPFGIDISDAKVTPTVTEANNILSNQFIANATSEDSEAYKDIATFRKTTYNQRIWFFVPKTYFTKTTSAEILAEFKTMIANNPIQILYELANKTTEPYTDEQKEVINSMVTEKGTNIFNINENTGIEAVEYEGLYPETVNYKYVVFKYTVYQLVVTGVDSEGVEVQEIKDTGCYYYQAIPLEKFKKMKVKIKYERG